MKEFYRNYACRPTESEKKGRRVKNQPKESCRCFVPFVKLHYYDCPAVKKSCPVHKSVRHRSSKEEKAVGQSMIISFHPSSKTERLFQPVKTLLAHCNPDTKVNLQYYSPKSTNSRDTIKLHSVHTRLEDERKSLNNVFVDKTKSFVSDKANKMKKLKQCFYSPCNSVVQKSRSQTSIKEKFNEIFRDEKKKMSGVGNYIPDKPPDDVKNDPNLVWFSSKFDFKDWEKLSRGKTDSDFITVTQQAKKDVINHKIFEIKHKKGLNDVPFLKMPKQTTQLVYPAFDANGPDKDKSDSASPAARRYTVMKESTKSKETPGEIRNKQKGDDELSVSNSETSSGSVYFTPIIFVPAAPTDSDYEGKGESLRIKGDEQKKASTLVSSVSGNPTMKSVQLQTDQSGDSTNQEWYHRYTEMAESFTTRGTQTDEVFFPLESNVVDSKDLVDESSESFAVATQIYSDEKQTADVNSADVKISKEGAIATPETRNFVSEESVVTMTRFTMTTTTTDKRCQTESVTHEVYKRRSVRINKSQVTADTKLSHKSTQTTFTVSESFEEEDSEFIVFGSSNGTYVVKPFDNQESDQTIDKMSKAWWGKSHSDGEMYGGKRCGCVKPEESIPLPPICFCPPSGATQDSSAPSNQPNTSRQSQTVQTSRKSVAATNESNANKSVRTTSGGPMRPETPKADKSIGTNSGGHRFYKRADKAQGTESLVRLRPETPKKPERVIETQTESQVNEAPDAAPSCRMVQCPRVAEFISRAEQTCRQEEACHSPFSDLSELTRIIHEFFQKSCPTTLRNCKCETQTASERKSGAQAETTDSSKLKKDLPDEVTDSSAAKEKKVILDEPKSGSKQPEEEPSSAKTEDGGERLESRADSDRVKIRRSVLLDDSQTKTRFVCSVCAREISIFSMNAATNTEKSYIARKKENAPSVSTEINEVLRLKTTRTVKSLDNPKSNAEIQTNDSEVPIATVTYKVHQENPRTSHKSSISSSKQGAVSPNDQGSQTAKSEALKQSAPNTTKTTTTAVTTTTRTITTSAAPTASNASKAAPHKACLCDDVEKIFILHTCPELRQDSNVASTSKAQSKPSEQQPECCGGLPTNQSRPGRRSVDKNRNQRRNTENCFPALIRLQWPRELAVNVAEKSRKIQVSGDSRSTSQQKRSYEKDAEIADIPAGKKIRAEVERPSRHCYVFAEPAFSDFRGDSKRGFYWVPSLSTSHVSCSKKHALTQSKTIKSEEKMRGATQSMCQEKFSFDGSSDLSSTKSCHPTSITLGCPDQQPFEKLFECRLGKSLTFIKSNKDDVVFPWSPGLIAYRPETLEDSESSTVQNDDEPSETFFLNDTSTQNFEKMLEECAKYSMRSENPSMDELVEEDVEEVSEEELESKSQTPDDPSLDDMFRAYEDAKTRWFSAYAKKK